MSIERVREYFTPLGIADRIQEFAVSSATVELAAAALGCIPAKIAKTLSFYGEDGCVLLVAAGDARVDNAKFKARFGVKARMLTPEDALAFTGYAVGGICPFGIENPAVKIYIDVSVQRFETIFPACGSSNSAVELTIEELNRYSGSLGFIDVCKNWQED